MKHMRMESGQPLLTLGQAANVIISPINLSSPHPSLAAAAAAMHVAPSKCYNIPVCILYCNGCGWVGGLVV